VIAEAGATFVNDHIAFRTFACQQPMTGIASVSRIFEALGYQAAGCYRFPDKHLSAIHFQHSNSQFPKIFISELQTWELDRASRETIERSIADHRPPLSSADLAALCSLVAYSKSNSEKLMSSVLNQFHELPWRPPRRDDVVQLNKASQYAAWVLVHGYNVNHFTCLINSHHTASLDDIEKTISALQKAGVPMKSEIEGERGSKLRQSATEAVMIDVEISEDNRVATMPWTYAYFELAERGNVIDPATGRPTRFEAFLGPQATQLFEMTRVAGR
jgi:hypothetical protein